MNNKNNFRTRGCKCAPNPQNKQWRVHSHSCAKLDVHNWLNNIRLPEKNIKDEFVEVRFKNSHKDFFISPAELNLEEGDIVAIEASPGHEIGIVTLTGQMAEIQMRNKNIEFKNQEFKKVYRRAKVSDVEKWISAVNLEKDTMYKSRKIASSLNLSMKISDVEYQGDMTKAIFYYTADDRVDFRELIKVLAESFGVRIEMRQIGMRQEAARLGGIGSCGREVCCSTWLTNFRSVSTNAARTQQLSLNPQKLAGQCGKLKCCINFENDCYLDYEKDLPDPNIILKTEKGTAIFKKYDTLNKNVYYAYKDNPNHMILLSSKRAWSIISMNKKNILPEDLEENSLDEDNKDVNLDIINPEEGNIERFDKPKKNKKRRRNKKRN